MSTILPIIVKNPFKRFRDTLIFIKKARIHGREKPVRDDPYLEDVDKHGEYQGHQHAPHRPANTYNTMFQTILN